MEKIFIIGDSHSLVLREYWQKQKRIDKRYQNVFVECISAGRVINNFILEKNGKKIVTPLLTQQLAKWGLDKMNNGSILFLLGTGEGIRLSLNNRWDKYYLADADDEPHHVNKQEIILFSEIVGLLEYRLKEFFEGINILREQGLNSFEFLCAPPPYLSNEKIISLYSSKRSELSMNISPAKPENRYKLYKAVEYVFQKFSAQINSKYIKNPPSVYDNHGFLKEQFERDGVHANVLYAKELFNHILEEK